MSKPRKKKRVLSPRRKRMDRSARLQAARHWLPNHAGKNAVRAYSRWFGVDRVCAIAELRMLGHKVDRAYEEAVQLGYLPRLEIKHTSEREIGQIYISGINWLLMIASIGLVVGFGSSSRLPAAYGVAVTAMPRPAKEPTGREINMIAVAIAIAWMAFFTGVLALTVFILENCLN